MSETARILLVDDDPALVEMASLFLSAQYELHSCFSGRETLALLKSGFAPDLILLDIDMPDMDGYETLQRLREQNVDTPVIFLSGHRDSDSELAGLHLGAKDYITKPFVAENLLARIHLRLEDAKKARPAEIAGIDEANFDALTAGLSLTEKKIARLIAQGFDNQEIVQTLSYSEGYVRNLTTQIFQKLCVSNRRQLRLVLRG